MGFWLEASGLRRVVVRGLGCGRNGCRADGVVAAMDERRVVERYAGRWERGCGCGRLRSRPACGAGQEVWTNGPWRRWTLGSLRYACCVVLCLPL
mgnify:CR=1 FL=1